ncbi:relaxase/mobilization nuclease domain-containing protein [Phaeobacter gallaeciensis]|uniref:relaxase/mobilization nuclease domain-containing protein n=1 Tax=Phaeobacter gallaeciensis TaxID=60890 RepID=UPI0004282DFD|nr:relaxase/mobilization nuclease domain-containing protein [Phaeobacter gallaeciensis]
MLIKFFSNGKGAGTGPVGYLVAREVLAYDANRDLIRDADGQPMTVTRDPLPEVLRGDPARTEALIDASRNQWTYRAGVISFTGEDAPTEAQQAEVMDAFEQLAFAGLDGEQFDMLWVRHSHEDRVELHFCTPRLELTTGKSLNIAPPGYQTAYDSLRDLMNKTHGWADPVDLDRAQEVQATVEAPTRAQGREELHEWILDQISVGTISDRASMIDALTDVGFDIPRASKNYITAKDPDTGERWRLKGEIFHDDWQAEPSSREIERGPGSDPQRARRLDGVTIAELQERYSGQCEARAGYNRDRYQHISGLEREGLAGPHQHDQTFDADFALDSELGLSVGGGRNTGIDALLELAAVGDDESHAAGDAGLADSTAREGDLSDPAAGNSEHSQLHDGRPDGFLHQGGGKLDGSAPDSLGTRLAGLRRAIGSGLRNLSTGIARLRDTLDGRDREEAEWVGAMRAAAHEITSLVSENIGRLADRGRDLRDARRELASQLEASESRRETAERELNERQLERGDSHGLGL